MNPILRNIIVVIIAVLIGGMVNMFLILKSGTIIPLPTGIDPMDSESLAQNIHLLEAKHFIFPFLAHALGTLVGAFIAAKYSTNNHRSFGMGIGVFFLLGGITSVFMIPAPTWFILADLVLAYIPMGWLGWKLSGQRIK